MAKRTPSQIGTNSKSKGSRFERKICSAFSKWCSNDLRDDLFWRAAMSGGRATLASRTGRKLVAQAGDISSIDPLGAPLTEKFFLECKHLSSLEIHRWVYNCKSPLDNVWDKPLKEATDHGKIPLVIAKQNRQPELVLSTRAGFELFRRASLREPLERLATVYRGVGVFDVWAFHDMVTRCTYDQLKSAIVDSERVRL